EDTGEAGEAVAVMDMQVAGGEGAEEVAEVAAVVVAAAEDGDNRTTKEKKTMKTKRNNMISSKMIALAAAILVTAFLVPASLAASKKKEAAVKQAGAQGTPEPGQKEFDTPKQAADALIQVATNLDVTAAKEILGPD